MAAVLARLMRSSCAVFLAVALAAATVPSARAATDAGKTGDLTFGEIAGAVVRVAAKIRPDARTARTLGTDRVGSGVLIGADGLILTIGYLIMEAEAIEVATRDGQSTPAEFVGYDHASGFGLIRARAALDARPMELGESKGFEQGAPSLVVSAGSAHDVTPVRVVSRRTFAGGWEYLLDDAIYTMPPHREFGGAALVGLDGKLVGVGSLFVGDAPEPDTQGPGNMFVPIDLLKPIMATMIATGRSGVPPRPWLGVYPAEAEGRVFVSRVSGDGPGAEAGLKPGDIIVGVKGRRVSGMADFYRKVWAEGAAGIDVALDVLPMGAGNLEIKRVTIHSRDRHQWLQLRRE